MTKIYHEQFATICMIYRFVYVRSSSIHRSMWVVYFISTRYPSNRLVWWGIVQYPNHNIYLHYWLLWIDTFANGSMRWLRSIHIYITIKWIGYPCKAIIGYRHDKSCVHNQQLRVDKLSECKGLGIIAIPRFGKLIADDRGWWYIYDMFSHVWHIMISRA